MIPASQHPQHVQVTVSVSLFVVLCGTLAWLLIGAPSSFDAPVSAQSGPPETFDVDVNDFSFSPAVITVTVGDTVTWTRRQGFHNVAADDGSFRLGDANGNPSSTWSTVSHTFNTVGTFRYYCELHGSPGGGGMSGMVVVEADTQATVTATAPATRSPTASATSTATAATATDSPVLTTTSTATTAGSTATATTTSTPTPTATLAGTEPATATASPTATRTAQPRDGLRSFLPLISNE